MPDPSPWLVRTRTTEGPTCLTTWTNSLCRSCTDGETGDDETGVDTVLTADPQPATVTAAVARPANASNGRCRTRCLIILGPSLYCRSFGNNAVPFVVSRHGHRPSRMPAGWYRRPTAKALPASRQRRFPASGRLQRLLTVT